MTALVLIGDVGCFAAGFAICWFWRSRVEAAVTATNQAVNQAKAAASTVVNDIKKI